ncbi:(Lyso)-N-acylphosphatidylethanolamine lipase-like isoform X2 [Octopus sinensis]|uniref:1-acylglycerol-3-phosphate O-acyltransferase ABHD5 n=1 Tax=Octopus sinensis TaxID=2607531 RepID=A0A7E6FSS0_9MOLL|nr:(Lyso)-N-acylphosphatidylethanolamine lipase-like isoform X2 [Octopus sinensis]
MEESHSERCEQNTWFNWRPTSKMQLSGIEHKIFQCIKTKMESLFVPIRNNECQIRTIVLNRHLEKMPLVMVHGMGGGVGMWVLNLDSLAEQRPVYAFDVLGFGRSSRPRFSSDSTEAESQFVDSIEEWREKMHLNRFILLGHSLGSFIATSYAIRHPERVHHLIAVEPWGFPEKPSNASTQHLSYWARAIITMARPFNPFAAVRAAGPWGPGLVKKFRSDLQHRFSKLFEDDTILNYLYHCNAQTPSGESAFRTMTIPFGWAKNPMILRMTDLNKSIPMTLIYGSRSWITSHTGQEVKFLRPDSYVDVQIIQGAGHHVYADRSDDFNELITEVCSFADQDEGQDSE